MLLNKYGLSPDAYHFMAGILTYIPEFTSITNPIVNSYKRLVPGYEAPVHIAWSAKNRSPLIRVPSAKGQATRIELRNPDPSANPYLAIALCLEAGLYGMENKIAPPEGINRNIFEMSKEELKEYDIKQLPTNLSEAISLTADSDFVKSVLGTHIFNKYITAKQEEWDEYNRKVSDHEVNKYISL